MKEALQIFQNERAVCDDAPKRRASVHLCTVGTGIQTFFTDAVVYGAEPVAERRFCTLHTAAGAIDHFRCDRYPIELCPQGGGFFAQSVVICNRCDSGVAGSAVQSTTSDQLICVFHSDPHKLKFVCIKTLVHIFFLRNLKEQFFGRLHGTHIFHTNPCDHLLYILCCNRFFSCNQWYARLVVDLIYYLCIPRQ